MLLEVMTICSLISISPYYDCSQEWEIRIYSQPPNIQCNNYDEFYASFGCTKLDTKTIHMVLFPQHRDKFGQTILEHELRHLRCECNFH
jgi:hypothetical protein